MTKHIIQDFDEAQLREYYAGNASSADRCVVWSPAEVAILGKISPITVRNINEDDGVEFPYDKNSLFEQAKTLAGTLLFSVDGMVLRGNINPNMLASKFNLYMKMHRALGTTPQVSINDRFDSLEHAVFAIKEDTLKVASRFPRSERRTTLGQYVESPDYVHFLEVLFSNNLHSVLRYGAGVRAEGKVLKLLVTLDNLDQSSYLRMAGLHEVLNGLDITLLPSDGYLTMASCGTCACRLTDNDVELLYGEQIDCALLTDEQVIRRKYIQAGKYLTNFRGALSTVDRIDAMVECDKDLISALKEELWIYHGLKQMEDYRTLTVGEVAKARRFSVGKIESPRSADYVKNLLFEANARVSKRVSEHAELLYPLEVEQCKAIARSMQ